MNKNEFNFEDALKRLEEIVRFLEAGQTSLEESINLYQEGVALVGKANKILSEAKQKLVNISGEAGDDE